MITNLLHILGPLFSPKPLVQLWKAGFDEVCDFDRSVSKWGWTLCKCHLGACKPLNGRCCAAVRHQVLTQKHPREHNNHGTFLTMGNS